MVSILDPDVVVAPADVKFGKKRASAQVVDELGNEWEGVVVANGPFVDGSVVLYGSKFPVLLLDEEEGRCITALRGSYGAAFEVFF